MTHEYDEEEKRAKDAHPPLTAAGTSSKAASSSSSTQLPIWTHGAGSRVHEAERSVRRWLDANVEKLGNLSLTLSQLVQCVLDSVPAAVKLSRVQVETVICEWATDHNIIILQTVPPSTGQSSTEKGKPDEKGHKKKDK